MPAIDCSWLLYTEFLRWSANTGQDTQVSIPCPLFTYSLSQMSPQHRSSAWSCAAVLCSFISRGRRLIWVAKGINTHSWTCLGSYSGTGNKLAAASTVHCRSFHCVPGLQSTKFSRYKKTAAAVRGEG